MPEVTLGNGYSVEVAPPVTDVTVEKPAGSDTSVTVVPVQGPAGPPGAGIAIPDLPASVTLSGHRLVVPTDDGSALQYADHTHPADLNKPLWLTTSAIAASAHPDLAIYGAVTEPSWSWPVATRLYVGATGLLTTTPPSSGYLRVAAVAVEPTVVWFDPQPAFVLI